MQIDIQARGFKLTAALRARVQRRLRFALGSTSSRVRSVVVRLAGGSGPRGGLDKRCTIRADLHGAAAVIIEQQEADLDVAIDRAADRAGRAVSRRREKASVGHRVATSAVHGSLDAKSLTR